MASSASFTVHPFGLQCLDEDGAMAGVPTGTPACRRKDAPIVVLESLGAPSQEQSHDDDGRGAHGGEAITGQAFRGRPTTVR